MTHHDKLVNNAAGLVIPDCAGELLEHQRYTDHRLTGMGPATITVTIWRCTACETLISEDDRDGVRNAYLPPVCALAEALDARRALG
jgi:hypothetical protein